jgi:hypothetical protein
MTFNDTDMGTQVVARAPGRPWKPSTDRRLVWVGGHLGELLAVVVCVVLAVWADPAWWLAVAAVGVGWAVNEARLMRLAAARGGVLTRAPRAGTDTASPAPGNAGGDIPGDVEDTREPA